MVKRGRLVREMNKADLLKEKLAISEWVSSLVEIDNDLWFQPFSEGKWAAADVISHFIMWDRFFLDHRVPYIEKRIHLPKMDINAEKMNKDASVYARSGISKQKLINEYIETRGVLLTFLGEWPDDIYNSVMKIGKSELTVIDYFHSHLLHDIKHKQQIVNFIKKPIT
jgi:hypothetical protein